MESRTKKKRIKHTKSQFSIFPTTFGGLIFKFCKTLNKCTHFWRYKMGFFFSLFRVPNSTHDFEEPTGYDKTDDLRESGQEK